MSDREKLINLSNLVKRCLQNHQIRSGIWAHDESLYNALRREVESVDEMKGWPVVCSSRYVGGMP